MAEQTYTAGQTYLITGGTGFIGSNVAMRLLQRSPQCKVVLFDRNPDLSRLTGFGPIYDAVKNRVTYVQGDLTILPHVLALFDTHERAGANRLRHQECGTRSPAEGGYRLPARLRAREHRQE